MPGIAAQATSWGSAWRCAETHDQQRPATGEGLGVRIAVGPLLGFQRPVGLGLHRGGLLGIFQVDDLGDERPGHGVVDVVLAEDDRRRMVGRAARHRQGADDFQRRPQRQARVMLEVGETEAIEVAGTQADVHGCLEAAHVVALHESRLHPFRGDDARVKERGRRRHSGVCG